MIYLQIALMLLLVTTNILMFFTIQKLMQKIDTITKTSEQTAVVIQNSLFAMGKDINFSLQQIIDRLPAPAATDYHEDDPDNPKNR